MVADYGMLSDKRMTVLSFKKVFCLSLNVEEGEITRKHN